MWFFQGVFLTDYANVLHNAQEGTTKALRQWRFQSIEDMDPNLILDYVKEAIQNQKDGKAMTPEKKETLPPPPELQRELDSNKELSTAFSGFTASKQREFSEFISSAKRQETKEKRLDKIIPMILNNQRTKRQVQKMKYVMILLFILSVWACAPSEEQNSTNNEVQELEFDSLLATELGADKYGMRKYVMAFLKAGPNRDQEMGTAAEIQRAHLDHINKLAEEGKLVLAGPFMDEGDIRGIFLFAVETLEEAEELTAEDPGGQSREIGHGA